MALATGCGENREEELPAVGREEPVRLIYYTIGEPDADLSCVEEALDRKSVV